MTTWRLAALLLVITAVLVVIGARAESHSTHHETAGHSEASEHTEERHADQPPERERVLGVDVESWPAVTLAVAVSAGLAVALWMLERRWLAVITALVALTFAVVDIAEVVHQVREHRAVLVALALVVTVGHLISGTLAARPQSTLSRE
jgi:hypothetical protein